MADNNSTIADVGQKTQQAMAVTSQKTKQAMETAMAGAAEVGRYGSRIVKLLWDPEPSNDLYLNRPVWCLGCQYINEYGSSQHPDAATAAPAIPPTGPSATPELPPSATVPATPPESSTSSFSSSMAYDDPEDNGWPPPFLDDFESRVWMTYRSGFEPIPRSTDSKALSALSFKMRLKALADQGDGFSSDTGWGCMIRSGQSLLANALVISQLGRGRCLFA